MMRTKRNAQQVAGEEFRREFARMPRRDKDFFLRDALMFKIRNCKYFDSKRLKMMQAFVEHLGESIDAK